MARGCSMNNAMALDKTGGVLGTRHGHRAARMTVLVCFALQYCELFKHGAMVRRSVSYQL